MKPEGRQTHPIMKLCEWEGKSRARRQMHAVISSLIGIMAAQPLLGRLSGRCTV